jgi:hypothetical protein
MEDEAELVRPRHKGPYRPPRPATVCIAALVPDANETSQSQQAQLPVIDFFRT